VIYAVVEARNDQKIVKGQSITNEATR
jgi:hypothetical protein